MEFYSDINKNNIMEFAVKWMEIENILNVVTQTQKDKCHVFSLICLSQIQIFECKYRAWNNLRN